MRAGDLVVTGARGGAVGSEKSCRTAERAVFTLDTDRETETKLGGNNTTNYKL